MENAESRFRLTPSDRTGPGRMDCSNGADRVGEHIAHHAETSNVRHVRNGTRRTGRKSDRNSRSDAMDAATTGRNASAELAWIADRKTRAYPPGDYAASPVKTIEHGRGRPVRHATDGRRIPKNAGSIFGIVTGQTPKKRGKKRGRGLKITRERCRNP